MNNNANNTLDEMLELLPENQRRETRALVDTFGEEGALASWLLSNDTAFPATIVADSPLKIKLTSSPGSFITTNASFPVKYSAYDDFDVFGGIDLSSPPPVLVVGDNNIQTPTLLNRFQKEFKKFICGDPHYGDERKQLDELKAVGIAAIAAAMATAIGVTSAILAPAIVLALSLVYKMGVALYCEDYVVPKDPETDSK